MKFRDDGYRIYGTLEAGDVGAAGFAASKLRGELGVEFCVVEYKHSDAPPGLVDELRFRMAATRTRDVREIQVAHDELVGVILGEAPMPAGFTLDELNRFACVLCWVLGHDHNPQFGDRLATFRRELERLGYTFKADLPRSLKAIADYGRDAGESVTAFVDAGLATPDELEAFLWFIALTPVQRADWLERAVELGITPAGLPPSAAEAWRAYKNDNGKES
jgi:hypothetical protein